MVDPQTNKLLMEAATLPPSEAIASFERWQTMVDFDDVSSDSYPLLPAVYKNLHRIQAENPLFPRLKGIYRRTWIENQLRIPKLVNVFEILKNKDIDFVVLTNFYDVLESYDDAGIFPFDRFEILVNHRDASATVASLTESGWKEVFGRFFYTNFSVLKYENIVTITISWQNDLFAKLARKSTRDFLFKSSRVRTLAASEQILYLVKNNNQRKIRSNRQSFLIYSLLESYKDFDWSGLVSKAQSCNLSFDLLNCLGYCFENMNKSIPPEIKSRLVQNAKSEPINKIRNIFSAYRSLQKDYLREAPFENTRINVLGFAKFLCRQWKVETIFALPFQIGKRIYLNGK